MSEMLLPIRPILRRALRAVEAFRRPNSPPWSLDWDGETLVFGRAALLPEELIKLWDAPELKSLETLARLVWESAACRNEPTVWLLRKYSPEASLIFLLCVVTNIPLDRLLDGDLSEDQSHRVTSVLASLADSDLSISETPEDDSFGERLNFARWRQGADIGVCDWILSPDEIQTAQQSRLQVFAPSEAPVEPE